ncbi:MAG: hypothetical protein M0Z60_09320 [Nitrospiraceae bacterium]|nr:hypothetical protein [Nitrospiraceae bacterium]
MRQILPIVVAAGFAESQLELPCYGSMPVQPKIDASGLVDILENAPQRLLVESGNDLSFIPMP